MPENLLPEAQLLSQQLVFRLQKINLLESALDRAPSPW